MRKIYIGVSDEIEYSTNLDAVVSLLSEALGIKVPTIIIDKDGPFPSEASAAITQFVPEKMAFNVFLNPKYFSCNNGISPLYFYVLAHELRHVYQFTKGTPFDDHISLDIDTDATSFGLLAVKKIFDNAAAELVLENLFPGMSKKERKKITDWMEYIEDEEQGMIYKMEDVQIIL